MRGADLNDVYVNAAGEVCKVVGICHEPTVRVKNLETGEEYHGGVSGYMWNGYRKLGKAEQEASHE